MTQYKELQLGFDWDDPNIQKNDKIAKLYALLFDVNIWKDNYSRYYVVDEDNHKTRILYSDMLEDIKNRADHIWIKGMTVVRNGK